MEFRVLGPLEVLAGERTLPLGGPKRRAALALLLLDANRVVPADRLVDGLWGESPPPAAQGSLQNHVSRLRRALGERIVTRAPGYLVRVEPDELDLERFRRLVGEARGSSPTVAAERLREALALWRGPALADLAGEPVGASGAHLDELRLSALEERIDADLELHRQADLVPELEGLLGSHPFRERLWSQLMLALYRSGRQADALEAYATARERLVEELGTEPGPALQELQRAILRQEDELGGGAAPIAATAGASATARAPEARKTVTVLAADLAVDGSATDPELRRDVATRLADEAARAVERHGAAAEHIAGNRVLAVFGVPTAHEDDALRAVRAAFDLTRAGVAAAVGIATGEVITGGPGEGQPAASGAAFEEADRLRTAAEGGAIVASPRTWALVRHAVCAVTTAEGHRLERLTADAPALVRHLETPLVGREGELALIAQAFERAARERRVQLLTVFGEPGIGKTRLAAEVVATLVADAQCLVGRCSSYGQDTTYAPLRDVVTTIAPGDVSARLDELLAGEPEGALVAERVTAAVGLASEEGGRVEETAWATRRLLETLARSRPVLLVLEDVHWAAPAFLDLVEHLADVGRAAMLVLCLARPELLDVRPTWGGGKLNSSSLVLDALSQSESETLLELLAPERSPSNENGGSIVRVADGNPLFLEQLLAAALEGEAEAVPDSIHALLAARLDRLAPEERAVLDAASICGDAFSTASVTELVGGDARKRLEGLVRRDLLRPADTPWLGEETWEFRHALIRDEAYGGIPKRRRAALHRAFAERVDRVAGERGMELDELVGYHLEQTVRLREEVGDVDRTLRPLADEAARRLGAAALRAYERHDVVACTSLLGRVVELLRPDSAERTETLLKFAGALMWAGDARRTMQVLDDARASAGRQADERLLARVTVTGHQIGLWTERAAATELVLADIAAATEILEQAGDDEGLAEVYLLQFHALDQGRRRGPEAALERSLEHARRAGSRFFQGMAQSWICITLPGGTVPIDDAIRRCVEIRDGAPNVVTRGAAVSALGELRAMQGAFDEGRTLVGENRAVLEELGLRQLVAAHSISRATIEMLADDLQRAAEILTEGYEQLAALGDAYAGAAAAWRLALVLSRLGRDADAEPFARIAAETTPRGFWVDAWATVVQARIASGRGSLDEAVAAADASLAAMDEVEESRMHVDAWIEIADVWGRVGRPDSRTALLERTAALADRLGYVVAAERVRAALSGS
jgi:DNA-binding SARP family transcriptional activator/tetratricopeptide (TPR) repeat protein